MIKLIIKPYNFEEDRVYCLEILERGRYNVRGRGCLTLEKALKWKRILDERNAWNDFRIRMKLSNGIYFSAWCASTPDLALNAIIRYFAIKAMEIPCPNIRHQWAGLETCFACPIWSIRCQKLWEKVVESASNIISIKAPKDVIT